MYSRPSIVKKKTPLYPEIPREFGDDGGKLYKHYDELAEEMDEDMINSIKAQLDGILIFAGLFAGVNSAFLALTLPQMSANPADDINALLFQLVTGNNNSIQAIDDLPSASFSPPPTIYPINLLFSMSLAIALLSSFLAVLGQQWLVQYRKRGGGGSDYQRWEQLRRHLGAKRWGLELILGNVLPTLLQFGLFIFCVSFALFLGTLNPTMAYAIAAPMGFAAAAIFGFAVCAAWDQWCPFKSPLSYFLHITLRPSLLLLGRTAAAGIYVSLTTFKRVKHSIQTVILPLISPGQRVRRSDVSLEEVAKLARKLAESVLVWLQTHSSRPADHPEDLKAAVVKRVICTSEDSEALVLAATNLQAYKDDEGLHRLLQNDEFHDRLHDLFHTSHRERKESNIRGVETKVLGNAFLYIILSAGSISDFCRREEGVIVGPRTSHHMRAQLANEGRKLIDVAKMFDDASCASCSHCSELALWGRMVGILVVPEERDFLQTAFQLGMAKVKDDRETAPKIVSLTAWEIVLSKEWASLEDPESDHRDRWCMEKAQSAVELYRQAGNFDRMCQLISDAVATSDSDWHGRPSVRDYLTLLYGGHKVLFWVPHYNPGTMLGSMGTLLISIEKLVRKPGTSSDEVKELRKQRKECIETYISAVCDCGPDMELDVWNATLTSLLHFLDWLKGVFEENPTTQENLLVLKLLQDFLSRAFPGEDVPPDLTKEIWTELRRVRSAIASPLAALESIIEKSGGLTDAEYSDVDGARNTVDAKPMDP